MSIALVTMVKNEAKVLPRLFDSVDGIVDKIIALDTGSEDGTVEILEGFGADIKRSSFVDFGASRTELLQFARGKADWFLLLDSDMTLQHNGERPKLDKLIPGYNLRHEGDFSYWTPRIIRGDLDWRFVGATHEYLDGPARITEKLPGFDIVHHDDGAQTNKTQNHADRLCASLAKDPTNSRTIFYLAQTFKELGYIDLARTLYLHRAKMGGWDEEVFYAKFKAAELVQDEKELMDCWFLRQTRAEPLKVLSNLYKSRGEGEKFAKTETLRRQIKPTTDILFVDLTAYGQ